MEGKPPIIPMSTYHLDYLHSELTLLLAQSKSIPIWTVFKIDIRTGAKTFRKSKLELMRQPQARNIIGINHNDW